MQQKYPPYTAKKTFSQMKRTPGWPDPQSLPIILWGDIRDLNKPYQQTTQTNTKLQKSELDEICCCMISINSTN